MLGGLPNSLQPDQLLKLLNGLGMLGGPQNSLQPDKQLYDY